MSAGTRRPGAFSRPACLLSSLPGRRAARCGQAVLFSPPRPPKRTCRVARCMLCHVTRSRLIAWPSSFFFSSFPSYSCFSLGSPAEYTGRIKSYSAENYRRRARRFARSECNLGGVVCARGRFVCLCFRVGRVSVRGRERGGERGERSIVCH